MTEILFRLSSMTKSDVAKNICNVDREDVLEGGFRCFNKARFNQYALLDVRFIGEDGIDLGGSMREFMRIATKVIASLLIFEGQASRRLLTLDYPCEFKTDLFVKKSTLRINS